MEVIRDLDNLNIQKSVVCVGNFDGLHRGHQEIVDRAITRAKQDQASSVVFSFWPHPQLVLNPDNRLEYLCTYEEKIALFKSTGIDQLVLFPFSREFAKIDSQSFITDYLIDKLKMDYFVIGYDHQYGKNREGNYEQLLKLSKEKGFGVERVEQKSFGGENISSTKIRDFLKNGKIQAANDLMAHPFFLIGKVEQGRQLGNRIGFPTANILYPPEKLVPKIGVYTVEVELNNERFSGIANLGYKPTISEESALTMEVHIFDFKRYIYGETIQVNLLDFLRAETKFDSIESLKQQIQKDVEKAKASLK